MQKMINFDVTKESIKQRNPNWPELADHPYKILIFGGSGFNLISHQPDINRTYLCAKNPHKAKYQCLINKREKNKLKSF